MKVNRVLLVGLGSIGKRHLFNLQQILPHAMLLVLRSRKGSTSADDYEIVTSIEAAIDFRPDMAVICTPSTFHMEVAWRLAKEGVHLFIEKPLSNRVQGTEQFVDMIDGTDLKVMVGYNLRFSPSLLAFKSLLEDERFGRVLMVSAEVGQYLPGWRPDVDYRSTVSASAELGGGALLELSHELDYLIWMLGKAVSASARMMKVSDLELDVEDLVLAHIEFQKNGRQLPVTLQLDFLQRQPYRRCKAVCEQATLTWNAISGEVEVYQQDGSSTYFQDDVDRNFTYEHELQTFIKCIEMNVPVPINAHDGLRVLELVEAIRRSSEVGRTIEL